MRRRVWRHGTVSAVGCMSFGGFYGPTSEADTMRALARSLELGADFWDTANVYGDGLCESLIGKFLAEDPGRRSRVTLATKFAIRRREDGVRFFDNSAAHMREALHGSLKRLGVDHIDLYYVHRVDKSIPIEDTVGELARLIKAGRIGAIGLSEAAPDTLRRAHAVHPIAAVQSEYSLWTRNPEFGLIQTCAEAGQLWSPSRRSDGGISAAFCKTSRRSATRISAIRTRASRASTGDATATASTHILSSPNHGA